MRFCIYINEHMSKFDMKKILTILAAMACLCGCEKIFIPMSVTLSSDGETVTVHTTIQPQTLDILNYDGDGVKMPKYDEETKTYTITNDWLTASISEESYEDGKYELVLTAVKNTTGKSRTLYVGGMDMNHQDSMEVTQK